MNSPTTLSGAAPAQPFLNPQAVETWDTWFRWRSDGQLLDVTIEDTWARVTSALTTEPSTRQPGYRRWLSHSLTGWHLLLDERVIAGAGTAAPQWRADDLHAALNAACFVRAPRTGHATFDFVRFEEIAALALHALDDAATLAGGDVQQLPCVRVGMIGLSDALALLGLAYDSDEGRAQAAAIARALAHGCLAGSIALGRDRGARVRCDDAWSEQARPRGYRRDLIEAAARYGLRQPQHTSIVSQPRLALFANGVADALDPLPKHRHGIADAATPHRCDDAMRATAAADVSAQLRLRAAVQPWIDEPITYPVVIDCEPQASDIDAWIALAHGLGLVPPTWRLAMRSAVSRPSPAPGTYAV
jgi:ribonucleoside-diphosphate reductase alpha chain